MLYSSTVGFANKVPDFWDSYINLQVYLVTPLTPCDEVANFTVPDNTTKNITDLLGATSTGATSKVFELGVGSILILNKTVTFVNCKFRCKKDAEIQTMIPTSGAFVFKSVSTKYFGCVDMWKGIKIKNGTTIQFAGSSISDAIDGISFVKPFSNTSNRLTTTTFENNKVGFRVGSSTNTGLTVGFTLCYGNKFLESALLKDGTHTNAGIVAEWGAVLNFGTTLGSKNTFTKLSRGIYVRRGAIITLKNSDVYSSKDYSNADANDGVGIFVNNGTINITGIGLFNNSFSDNNLAGIYVINSIGPLTIENAKFSGIQRYGILLKSNLNPVPFNIINNRFEMPWTKSLYPIEFDRPMAGSWIGESNISRNYLTSSGASDSSSTIISYLNNWIVINQSLGVSNNILNIKHNVIFNTTNATHSHGIYVTGNSNNTIVSQDTIKYIGSPLFLGTDATHFENFGIAFENVHGKGNRIEKNVVNSWIRANSMGVIDPENYNMSYIKCAIHSLSSDSLVICTNKVDGTLRGFHFAKDCSGTLLSANITDQHTYALYFSKGDNSSAKTNISDQIRTGNKFTTDAAHIIANGKGAIYKDDLPLPFVFRTKFATVYTPLTYEPNGMNGLFVNNPDPNTVCVEPLSGGDIFTETEKSVANGSYPYNGQSATQWDFERRLWQKLLKYPGIESTNPDVFAFYNQNFASTAYKYAIVLNKLEKALSIPAGTELQLNNLYNQLSTKSDEIKTIENQLSADTVNISSTVSSNFNTKIGQYATIWKSIVDIAASNESVQTSSLNALQNDINQLSGTQLYENYWITIMNSAVTRMRGNELSQTQRSDLLTIANTCASAVGDAAKIAVMYMNIEDAAPYMGLENNTNCTNYTVPPSEERSNKPNENTVVYPNPSHSQLFFNLPPTIGEGRWQVYTLSGELKQEGTVLGSKSKYQIDISAYPDGLYFLKVISEQGNQSSSKFSVIK